jgi:hypothetical protein
MFRTSHNAHSITLPTVLIQLSYCFHLRARCLPMPVSQSTHQRATPGMQRHIQSKWSDHDVTVLATGGGREGRPGRRRGRETDVRATYARHRDGCNVSIRPPSASLFLLGAVLRPLAALLCLCCSEFRPNGTSPPFLLCWTFADLAAQRLTHDSEDYCVDVIITRD